MRSSHVDVASHTELSLPSGRSVVVDPVAETIEVRAPGGEVELQVTLTENGPLLKFRGASLELEAADAVRVQCREMSVETREGFRVRAGGDVALDGDYVNLNCGDRAGYHDADEPR